MGKWRFSNWGSAHKTPEPLPEQLQNRFWNGKEKWVFHLLDVEERAGVCRAALSRLQGLAGRLTGPSTCLWLVCSQLRWVTARSRDAREGGPLLWSPHDPSCPLLLSRVSRVSLPPATKARTMTVTRTPVPPGKLTRGLAPSWGLVTWCSLPSPSKMPVPRRGAGVQHEPHGLCKQHRRRGLPLTGGGRV